MKGDGIIVMRVANGRSDNGHNYFEHDDLAVAKSEAHRLAQRIGGRFVVYVPIAIVEQTPPTVETRPRVADNHDIDLPF